MDAVRIIDLAMHVLGARSREGAESAFATLCNEDPESARLLAVFISRALPQTVPVWAAIIVAARHSADWDARDPADTANAVERFLGASDDAHL